MLSQNDRVSNAYPILTIRTSGYEDTRGLLITKPFVVVFVPGKVIRQSYFVLADVTKLI
jgi:hypothetical protein